MSKIQIMINGEAFPCQPTMGAMLRFKKETGKEITEIDPKSFTELCTYLWCCVASASKRAGKKFDLSLMDFADSLSPEEMGEWSKSLQVEDSATDEKKSPQGSSNS